MSSQSAFERAYFLTSNEAQIVKISQLVTEVYQQEQDWYFPLACFNIALFLNIKILNAVKFRDRRTLNASDFQCSFAAGVAE